METKSNPSATYQRPAELLRRLIQFNTTNPPGNEAECISFINGLLAEAGVETTILGRSPERPNLIARLPGRGSASPLLLYGHVDVVTTENQQWQLRRYVRGQLGSIRLQSLHPLQIQSLYSSLTQEGLSSRIVRYAHTLLSNAFGQAVRWRLLTTNPCAAVELPRKHQTEANFLTPEEAAKLVKELRGTRHEVLFVLALMTGMRPSEYLGLPWKDVDLDSCTVRVQRTIEWRYRGRWQFAEPKTKKSRRGIPIPPEVVDLLKTHRKAQLEVRLKAGSDWTDHDLVFSDKLGGPLDRQNLLRRHFRPTLQRAGFDETLTLYSLRHSCASLLLAAGVHPKIVSERLGHASITTTLDLYSHIAPTLQEEATARLGEIVFSSYAAVFREGP